MTFSRYSTLFPVRRPSARSARSASKAWISTPISRPRFDLAVLLSEAPVPPSAIAISLTPDIDPPVISTLFEFCFAIVPILSVKTKLPNVSRVAYCPKSGRPDRSL